MIIKPSVRSNFFTNAHPLGVKKMLTSYIDEVKSLPSYEGPKNVLIIGGSSGYGLASRISLAFGASAQTINVSFENLAKDTKTGSAGFWNNLFFQDSVKGLNKIHLDFNGDAFSPQMKSHILNTIKEKFGTIDLLIYSLASGARKDYKNDVLIRSYIKPLNQPAIGKTIDIKTMRVEPLTVEPANESETHDTVFVMGGGDWFDWVSFLDQNGALAKGFKTISYTYIGGKNTDAIYRHGTLGKAKEDLENVALKLDALLKEKYQGEALISSSKAIVSKASVFIPQMPIYVSYLFDVMTKNKTHETTLLHKHRLFKDMIYGNKRIVDDKGRIRLDHLEMQREIQNEVHQLMQQETDPKFFDLVGTKMFINEFYNINGFSVEGIDEEADIDIPDLLNIYQTKHYEEI